MKICLRRRNVTPAANGPSTLKTCDNQKSPKLSPARNVLHNSAICLISSLLSTCIPLFVIFASSSCLPYISAHNVPDSDHHDEVDESGTKISDREKHASAPKMHLPKEHLDFGKCNIRPGRHPSFAPPTTGFTMDISNDYPDQDTSYYPKCSKEDYPEAWDGAFEGQFTSSENSSLPVAIDVQQPYESAKVMGVGIHIKDSVFPKYRNVIPSNGPHRTMWAAYGEYSYCPPQRYMHNLEHGAIVFMYHPCAPEKQVDILKSLAENCLWKHIITSWQQGLNSTYPFALVAWSHVMFIQNFDHEGVNTDTILKFITRRAKAGGSGEGNCWGNGGFVNQLLHNASLVTTVEDDSICPKGFVLPTEEKEVKEPIKYPDSTAEVEVETTTITTTTLVATESTTSTTLPLPKPINTTELSKSMPPPPLLNQSALSTTNLTKALSLPEPQDATTIETSTIAAAVKEHPEKVLHEAVLASAAVLFLLVVIAVGARGTGIFSSQIRSHERRNSTTFPRSGNLTVGSLLRTFSGQAQAYGASERGAYMRIDDMSSSLSDEEGGHVIFSTSVEV